MKPNKKQVGMRINEIRERDDSTLKEFGERLGGKLGTKRVKEGIISRWENGISLPNSKRIKIIAEMGKVSVEELLYGDSKQFILQVLSSELHERNEFYEKLKTYFLLIGKNINEITDINNDPIFIQNNYVSFLQKNIDSITDFIKNHNLFTNDEQLYEEPQLIIDLAILYVNHLIFEDKNIVYYGDDYKLTLVESIKLEEVREQTNHEVYILSGKALLEKTDFVDSGDHIELDYYATFNISLFISKGDIEHQYSFEGYGSLEKKPYEEVFEEYIYNDVKRNLVEYALKTKKIQKFNLKFNELEELSIKK